MTKKKSPDKNIYPDFSNEYKDLISRKIEHLIETIKRFEQGSTQTSIGNDSGVGKNFLSRLKSKQEYTYFDVADKTIDNFVNKLNDKYPLLDLNNKIFYSEITIEEFKNKVSTKKNKITKEYVYGIPRIEYKIHGRENDLHYLKQIIENDISFNINIKGPPCIGKTTLAIELANQTVNRIFDRIVWVTARKSYFFENNLIRRLNNEIEIEYVLNSIIIQNDRKQDLHTLDFNEKYNLAINIITNNKILLIIDNFELVNDNQINDFILKIPSPSKVLVTSRDILSGFKNIPITRIDEKKVYDIIEEYCIQSQIQLDDQEIEKLERTCDGNLVAIKWILGQIATLKLRLDLIIKNLNSDSNTYILDHIFNFTFSELDTHSKIVLLTLANSPLDITGDLIANSVIFHDTKEIYQLSSDIFDQVEKSLGILIKFGLVSEIKNNQSPNNSTISLLSNYKIPLITANYVKSKYSESDIPFHKMLYCRFLINIQQYNKNCENDKNQLIEFLFVWSSQALAILNEIKNNIIDRDIIRIYIRLKIFLGIVNTKPSKLSVARFNLNAKLYNTETSMIFFNFIEQLLLIENKFRRIKGNYKFYTNTFHQYKNLTKYVDINHELDKDDLYEEYLQVRATLIYKYEDVEEVSHCNHYNFF